MRFLGGQAVLEDSEINPESLMSTYAEFLRDALANGCGIVTMTGTIGLVASLHTLLGIPLDRQASAEAVVKYVGRDLVDARPENRAMRSLLGQIGVDASLIDDVSDQFSGNAVVTDADLRAPNTLADAVSAAFDEMGAEDNLVMGYVAPGISFTNLRARVLARATALAQDGHVMQLVIHEGQDWYLYTWDSATQSFVRGEEAISPQVQKFLQNTDTQTLVLCHIGDAFGFDIKAAPARGRATRFARVVTPDAVLTDVLQLFGRIRGYYRTGWYRGTYNETTGQFQLIEGDYFSETEPTEGSWVRVKAVSEGSRASIVDMSADLQARGADIEVENVCEFNDSTAYVVGWDAQNDGDLTVANLFMRFMRNEDVALKEGTLQQVTEALRQVNFNVLNRLRALAIERGLPARVIEAIDAQRRAMSREWENDNNSMNAPQVTIEYLEESLDRAIRQLQALLIDPETHEESEFARTVLSEDEALQDYVQGCVDASEGARLTIDDRAAELGSAVDIFGAEDFGTWARAISRILTGDILPEKTTSGTAHGSSVAVQDDALTTLSEVAQQLGIQETETDAETDAEQETEDFARLRRQLRGYGMLDAEDNLTERGRAFIQEVLGTPSVPSVISTVAARTALNDLLGRMGISETATALDTPEEDVTAQELFAIGLFLVGMGLYNPSQAVMGLGRLVAIGRWISQASGYLRDDAQITPETIRDLQRQGGYVPVVMAKFVLENLAQDAPAPVRARYEAMQRYFENQQITIGNRNAIQQLQQQRSAVTAGSEEHARITAQIEGFETELAEAQAQTQAVTIAVLGIDAVLTDNPLAADDEAAIAYIQLFYPQFGATHLENIRAVRENLRLAFAIPPEALATVTIEQAFEYMPGSASYSPVALARFVVENGTDAAARAVAQTVIDNFGTTAATVVSETQAHINADADAETPLMTDEEAAQLNAGLAQIARMVQPGMPEGQLAQFVVMIATPVAQAVNARAQERGLAEPFDVNAFAARIVPVLTAGVVTAERLDTVVAAARQAVSDAGANITSERARHLVCKALDPVLTNSDIDDAFRVARQHAPHAAQSLPFAMLHTIASAEKAVFAAAEAQHRPIAQMTLAALEEAAREEGMATRDNQGRMTQPFVTLLVVLFARRLNMPEERARELVALLATLPQHSAVTVSAVHNVNNRVHALSPATLRMRQLENLASSLGISITTPQGQLSQEFMGFADASLRAMGVADDMIRPAITLYASIDRALVEPVTLAQITSAITQAQGVIEAELADRPMLSQEEIAALPPEQQQEYRRYAQWRSEATITYALGIVNYHAGMHFEHAGDLNNAVLAYHNAITEYNPQLDNAALQQVASIAQRPGFVVSVARRPVRDAFITVAVRDMLDHGVAVSPFTHALETLITDNTHFSRDDTIATINARADAVAGRLEAQTRHNERIPAEARNLAAREYRVNARAIKEHANAHIELTPQQLVAVQALVAATVGTALVRRVLRVAQGYHAMAYTVEVADEDTGAVTTQVVKVIDAAGAPRAEREQVVDAAVEGYRAAEETGLVAQGLVVPFTLAEESGAYSVAQPECSTLQDIVLDGTVDEHLAAMVVFAQGLVDNNAMIVPSPGSTGIAGDVGVYEGGIAVIDAANITRNIPPANMERAFEQFLSLLALHGFSQDQVQTIRAEVRMPATTTVTRVASTISAYIAKLSEEARQNLAQPGAAAMAQRFAGQELTIGNITCGVVAIENTLHEMATRGDITIPDGTQVSREEIAAFVTAHMLGVTQEATPELARAIEAGNVPMPVHVIVAAANDYCAVKGIHTTAEGAPLLKLAALETRGEGRAAERAVARIDGPAIAYVYYAGEDVSGGHAVTLTGNRTRGSSVEIVESSYARGDVAIGEFARHWDAVNVVIAPEAALAHEGVTALAATDPRLQHGVLGKPVFFGDAAAHTAPEVDVPGAGMHEVSDAELSARAASVSA
jgi:hypothetical protein